MRILILRDKLFVLFVLTVGSGFVCVCGGKQDGFSCYGAHGLEMV